METCRPSRRDDFRARTIICVNRSVELDSDNELDSGGVRRNNNRMEGEPCSGQWRLNFLLPSGGQEECPVVHLGVVTVEFDTLPMDPLIDVVKEWHAAKSRYEPLEHWIGQRRRSALSGSGGTGPTRCDPLGS